ncbi:MAG TPA: hypothetical protein VGL40_07325 [Bacillota bacterium]|jgi:ArsR family transcriptional regulator
MEKLAHALSDPLRLKVLDLVAAGRAQGCCSPDNPEMPDGVCACDVEDKLRLAPSKLAYHIK